MIFENKIEKTDGEFSELGTLVRRVLCVNKLCEQEVAKVLAASGNRSLPPLALFLIQNIFFCKYLKTGGSGIVGPKKGTSSRAVTDTCDFAVPLVHAVDDLYLVARVVAVDDWLHDDIRVQEVGGDDVGREGRVRLLKE